MLNYKYIVSLMYLLFFSASLSSCIYETNLPPETELVNKVFWGESKANFNIDC